MNTISAVAGVGLLIGGAVAASVYVGDRGGPVAAPVDAGMRERVASLEHTVGQLAAAQRAAEAEATEAMLLAATLRDEVDRARDDYDELLSLLTSPPAATPAPGAGPLGSAPHPAGLAAPAPPAGAAPASELAGLQPLTRGAGGPAPETVAIVQEALADIREREAEKRTAEREAQRLERVKRRMDVLAERLNLQPFQREEIRAIYEETRSQRRDLIAAMRKGELDRTEARGQMGGLQQDERQKIETVLDAAQLAELDALEEEERSARKSLNRTRGFQGMPD